MKIKVLGTGCQNCKNLENITKSALSELNLDIQIEKVQDIQKIMEYGVLRTPALVIDDKIVVEGKIPTLQTVKNWIETRLTHQS